MPVLFVLALTGGVVAGALVTPMAPEGADPRLTVAWLVVGPVLAALAAVVLAARDAGAELLLDRPVDTPVPAGGDPLRASGEGSAGDGGAEHPFAVFPLPPVAHGRLGGLVPAAREKATAMFRRRVERAGCGGASVSGITGPVPREDGEHPRPRTAPVLRLPQLRPCYRRWLAPTLPADADDAAFAAWLDLVLAERARLAWGNAAVALFVPVPAGTLEREGRIALLERRLAAQTGIDVALVPELGSDDRFVFRLPEAWASLPRLGFARRLSPSATIDPASSDDPLPDGVRWLLVDATALLRAADSAGPRASALRGRVAELERSGRELVAVDVRDPRDVSRLARLGVRFATGPGLARVGGSTFGVRTEIAERRLPSLGSAASAGGTGDAPEPPATPPVPGGKGVAASPSPLAERLAAADRRAAGETLPAGAGEGAPREDMCAGSPPVGDAEPIPLAPAAGRRAAVVPRRGDDRRERAAIAAGRGAGAGDPGDRGRSGRNPRRSREASGVPRPGDLQGAAGGAPAATRDGRAGTGHGPRTPHRLDSPGAASHMRCDDAVPPLVASGPMPRVRPESDVERQAHAVPSLVSDRRVRPAPADPGLVARDADDRGHSLQ